MRQATRGGILLAATWLAAGCGTPTGQQTATGPASSTAPTPAASTATTGAATPSATATPFPRAADGTRLSSCADGRCEVELRRGDTLRLPARYGVDRFVVTSVKDESVAWRFLIHPGKQGPVEIVSGPHGGMSYTCTDGRCVGSVGGTGGHLRALGLRFDFLAFDGGRTIARVRPQGR